MKHRFGRLITTALTFALLAGIGLVPATGTALQPNFVVIMTDDQTVEQLRVMERTRRLIGVPGATFTNSFSSFPLCCPSRATFLTGQYAHNHGVLENDAPTGGYERLDKHNTLGVWLQRAGYRTIHVGKFLNEYGRNDPTEVPPGWHEWIGAVDPSTYWMWGYTLNENGTPRTYGTYADENPRLYQTDVYRAKTVDAVRRAARAGGPFYVQAWFLAPHREVSTLAVQTAPRSAPRHRGVFANEPLPRPASFNEANMLDKPSFMQVKPRLDAAAIDVITNQYRAELETLLAVDEAVGEIMDALEDTGALRDTYVIFTSDNGYFHGEHRTPDEKILGYEPSARVPLLIRGPGIAPGTEVHEFVANVDLAPTIVGLAGATPTKPMDGRSLVPYLTNPRLRTTRPVLLEAYFPIGSAVSFFTGQINAGGGGGGGGGGGAPSIPLGKALLGYQGIRTERYVYFEYTSGEHELYDLARDPDQLLSRHLDPDYAQVQIALAQHLTWLRLCAGAACRAETGPIPDPS